MQFNEAHLLGTILLLHYSTERCYRVLSQIFSGSHNRPITSLSLGGMPVELLHIQSSACRLFSLITYIKRLIWGCRFLAAKFFSMIFIYITTCMTKRPLPPPYQQEANKASPSATTLHLRHSGWVSEDIFRAVGLKRGHASVDHTHLTGKHMH